MLKQQIRQIVQDNPEYWAYIQVEVSAVASNLLNDSVPKSKFDMGL